MNITAIYGSPRVHGNSNALTDRLTQRMEEKGASVQRFHLNTMNYRGCQGCMGCKTPESHGCILKDDLTEVLNTIPDADVLLISSAVYYGDVTSQAKGFIDRFYSFYKPEFWLKPDKTRLKPGKKLVFILTQGNADEALYSGIASKYHALLGIHGFEECHTIRGCGVFMLGDAMNRPDVLVQIDQTADALFNSVSSKG